MTDTAPKQSVRRAIALIWILRGHVIDGLRLKEIADAAQQAPGTTLRDLAVLEAEGIAERIPGRKDYWRLGPRLVQVAIAHEAEMAAAQHRLDDTRQRYSRAPT